MLAVKLAPTVEKRLERLDDVEDAEIALQRLRKPARRESLEDVARRLNVRLEG